MFPKKGIAVTGAAWENHDNVYDFPDVGEKWIRPYWS